MKKLELTDVQLANRAATIAKEMETFMNSIGGSTYISGAGGNPGESLSFSIVLPKILKFLGWTPDCEPCTDMKIEDKGDHYLVSGVNNIEDRATLLARMNLPPGTPVFSNAVQKGFGLIIDTGIDDFVCGPDENGKIMQHPLYRFIKFTVGHTINMSPQNA